MSDTPATKRLLTAPGSSGKKKKKQKNKHSVLANSNAPKKTPAKQSNANHAGPKPKIQAVDTKGGIGVVDGATEDSAETARALFEWMIHPITVQDFYENYWEKKPLLIQRDDRDYYDGWFSKARCPRVARWFCRRPVVVHCLTILYARLVAGRNGPPAS